jgi:hypothetical protein
VHPILGHRDRLLLYLALWTAFGALLAAVIASADGDGIGRALALAEPLALLLGVQSLSFWYLVRVLPPADTPVARLAGTWLGAGACALGLWLGASLAWFRALRAVSGSAARLGSPTLLALLVFAGCIGLLVAVLGQYLLAAFERSRAAERGALELRLLAREAELRFLRDQIDPHFLFNSLNSVAALIGSDAAGARRMCFLMADFFRQSLRLGAQPSIALADELEFVGTFLDIEQVRFGERLRRRIEIAEGSERLAVPPLVLQPLVENAVHHGIAHLISGGEIMISARRLAGSLELVVENPCDAERPPSRGTGLGLKNVRARIERLFGTRASVEVQSVPDRFRVAILLPATAAEELSACAS